MTSPALPAGLAGALQARLDGRPRQALAESARRLSESYRARKPTRDAIRDETDALAYALTRMPATYGAVVSALGRLASEQPDFAPESLLDVGCGLGAGAYAAAAVWPGIARVELIDRSRAFLDLAAALAQESGEAAVAGATIATADMTRLPEGDPADLVVIAYALTELADADLGPVTDAVWSRTRGALVIVEPGTPRDHQRLMAVRARLIDRGARLLAPCPHASPCPLVAPDWCHFSVRLPRSRAHKALKGAEAPFEDEKFSYLVAARTGVGLEMGLNMGAAARVIGPARHGKPGVTLKLCAQEGLRELLAARRDKARYDSLRRKDWGDSLDALPEDAK